jgi:hypothetical protein
MIRRRRSDAPGRRDARLSFSDFFRLRSAQSRERFASSEERLPGSESPCRQGYLLRGLCPRAAEPAGGIPVRYVYSSLRPRKDPRAVRAGQAVRSAPEPPGGQVVNVDCRHDLYRFVMYSIETASLRRAHQPTRLPESRIVVAQPRARRRTAPQSGRNSCPASGCTRRLAAPSRLRLTGICHPKACRKALQ